MSFSSCNLLIESARLAEHPDAFDSLRTDLILLLRRFHSDFSLGKGNATFDCVAFACPGLRIEIHIPLSAVELDALRYRLNDYWFAERPTCFRREDYLEEAGAYRVENRRRECQLDEQEATNVPTTNEACIRVDEEPKPKKKLPKPPRRAKRTRTGTKSTSRKPRRAT